MRLIFHLIILLVIFAVDLQGQQKTVLPKQPRLSDTITAIFSMCETIRGDTVMFKSATTYERLKRFFYRNLRYPLDRDSVPTTLCKLYFIIDKEGQVTDAGCAAGVPEPLANEVVRVARKLGTITPGNIKGRPVITRVEMRIVYYEGSKEAQLHLDEYKADVLVGVGTVCRLPANRGTVH